MKITAAVLAATMTFTSAFSFAAGPQCSAIVEPAKFMKHGVPADAPPDKIYRFKQMRDDLVDHLEDPHHTMCMNDAYRAGINQEAQYWGKRLADAGCQLNADGDVDDSCSVKKEVRESNEFLYNLEHDSNAEIRRAVEISREEREREANAPKNCPFAAHPVQQTAAQIHQSMCCGSPSQKGSGAVRAIDTNISYNECLGKIGENDHSVIDSAAQCLGSVVSGGIHAIIGAIKGLWHLPGMIGQLWSLITNKAAQRQFIDKISEYVKNKKRAVWDCYNRHEKAQEVCRDVGAILVAFASPESAAALFSVLAKPVGAVGRAMEIALQSSSKGRAVLSGLNKTKALAEKGAKLASDGAGKTPGIIKKPISYVARKTGQAFKTAERGRAAVTRTLRLAKPAEIAAQAAMKSGVYRRALLAAYRAERAARNRAGQTFAEAGASGAGVGASVAGAVGESTSVSRVGERTASRVTSISGKGSASVARVPKDPPLGRSRLSEAQQGPSGSFTVKPEPRVAPVEPKVSVRFEEPRKARSNESASQSAPDAPEVPKVTKTQVTPELREAQTRVADFERATKELGSDPDAARDLFGENASNRVIHVKAKEHHRDVDVLQEKGLLSADEARRMHDGISLVEQKATGGRLREWSTDEERLAAKAKAEADASRLKNEARDGASKDTAAEAKEGAAGDAQTTKNSADATDADAAVPATASRVVSSSNSGGSSSIASDDVPLVPRGPGHQAPTSQQLTKSKTYIDNFSSKIEHLSSDSTLGQREAGRAFRSSRPDKIHNEANALHEQVDDLLSANRITSRQATNYHQNISLGESYATKSPTVREWTSPVATAPVEGVPVTPVVETATEEAPIVDGPSDVIYRSDAPVAAVPAPLAKPTAKVSNQAASAVESAPSRVAAPKPSERALATKYQSTLDEIAPKLNINVPAKDSYLTGKYWRTWAGTHDLPEQGWKLHVSATPEKAVQIAKLLLPELRKRKIGHKIAADLNEYMARPSTDTQFGKFITIYPKTVKEAREIAGITEKIMKKAGLKLDDFPTPPGEQIAGVGVFARYGRVTGGFLHDAKGAKIPNSYDMIRTPDGRLVPDVRGEPIDFAGQLMPVRKPGLIQRVRDRLKRKPASDSDTGFEAENPAN